MSAAKAGTYVLAASAFYRVEGEGDEATRRRYKRGDRVQLSKAEAARLAVPTRLAPAAFVKASDDVEVAPGADLVTSPPLAVNRTSEANQLIAEANSGIDLGGGAVSVPTPADTEPTGGALVDGKPAKSATLDVWREYAVKVGAVTEADSGDLNKAALQQAVADHEAKQA
ncbi:head-tail connector [Mycobacterium phage Weirdo19]|uniref:Head-tail connector n=1 Tax=Mycobacterium phage Weirdo19 TaxID=2601610 RepID=A0A6M2YSF5_9CAUD|nr:head-tail connector [Mycobacterium phage Weirdo19]QEA10775.1 head-tail connector [Mycobacterium phage Weirdo19]